MNAHAPAAPSKRNGGHEPAEAGSDDLGVTGFHSAGPLNGSARSLSNAEHGRRFELLKAGNSRIGTIINVRPHCIAAAGRPHTGSVLTLHFHRQGAEQLQPCGIEVPSAGAAPATKKDKNSVSQSRIMSLPGRFMLVVAVAAVFGLMAAMMVRTLEIHRGETFAKAEQNDVIEAHKPLPAGPRRFE